MGKVMSSIFERDGDLPNPPEGFLRVTTDSFMLDGPWIRKNLVPNISATQRQREAGQNPGKAREYRDFTEPVDRG